MSSEVESIFKFLEAPIPKPDSSDPRTWAGYSAFKGLYFRNKETGRLFQQIGRVPSNEVRPDVWVFQDALTNEIFWTRDGSRENNILLRDSEEITEMEAVAWASR